MNRIVCLLLALAFSALFYPEVLFSGALAQSPTQTTLELNPAAAGKPQRPVNEATLRQQKALQPTVSEYEGIEVFKIDANGQPIRSTSATEPASAQPTNSAAPSGSNLSLELKLDNLPGFRDSQSPQRPENPQWKAAFQPPTQTTNGIVIPKEYQAAPTDPASQPVDYSQGVPLVDPDASAPSKQPASDELKIDQQDVYRQIGHTPQQPAASSTKAASADGPRFSFESNTYEFGQVKEGDVVRYEIKFRNTGNAPLKLTSVKASCGCTAADWPRDEIKPGEQGTIHVKFNTAGRLGPQNKSITVFTNEASGSPHAFYLKGEVFKHTPPSR